MEVFTGKALLTKKTNLTCAELLFSPARQEFFSAYGTNLPKDGRRSKHCKFILSDGPFAPDAQANRTANASSPNRSTKTTITTTKPGRSTVAPSPPAPSRSTATKPSTSTRPSASTKPSPAGRSPQAKQTSRAGASSGTSVSKSKDTTTQARETTTTGNAQQLLDTCTGAQCPVAGYTRSNRFLKEVIQSYNLAMQRGISPNEHKYIQRTTGHHFKAFVVDHFSNGRLSKDIVQILSKLTYDVTHVTSNYQRGDLCGFIAVRNIRTFYNHMLKHYPDQVYQPPAKLQVRVPTLKADGKTELMPDRKNIVWMSKLDVPRDMRKEVEYETVKRNGEIDDYEVITLLKSYKLRLRYNKRLFVGSKEEMVLNMIERVKYIAHYREAKLDDEVGQFVPCLYNVINTEMRNGGSHWVTVFLF